MKPSLIRVTETGYIINHVWAEKLLWWRSHETV